MTSSAEVLSQAWKLHQSGEVAAAEKVYRQVLAAEPRNANAWCYLGIACFDTGRLEESVAAYQGAVAINPGFAIGWNNLGNSLRKLGRYSDAVRAFETALRHKPDYVNAHLNRGAALLWLGELEQGMAAAEKALALSPGHFEASKVAATARLWLGRLDEAASDYRALLAKDPDEAEVHKNLSMILLLRGQFEEGWKEYNWRRKSDPRQSGPSASGPQWEGSSLDGKTILLMSEQGLGDTIQFIRYAALLKERWDCRVIAAVQKSLLPLFQSVRGVDTWLARGDTPPDYDVWTPLLGLPAALGQHRMEDFPAQIPYIQADQTLVEKWRERLRCLGGFQVGIAWQGNPRMETDRFRSIPLREFGPLFKLRGVRLISLQRNDGLDQLDALAGQWEVVTFDEDFDRSAGPFMDTAAVMKNLDLVITSDTAIAHLAGALGVPTWLALTAVPDWRWFLERDDSPWYPTLRLFRQKVRGDWTGVFQEIREALQREHPELPAKTPEEYRVMESGMNCLVRSRHGLMLYNRNDQYIGRSLERYGEFSPGEVEIFRQVVRPGSVALEAGANIGAHTVVLAQLVGETGFVHAFEPQRVVFQTLCANVALASRTNVHCHQGALGESPGEVTIPPLDYRRQNNFGGLGLGDISKGETVPVITIDSLNLPRCDFLKADVEGMELAVLRGGAETIRRCQPLLYVENDRPEKSAELIEFIRSLGYKLYWHHVPLFHPRNYFENPVNEFGSIVSHNMLCIPNSIPANISGLREVQ